MIMCVLPSVCLHTAVVIINRVADIKQCESDHEYQPRSSAIKTFSKQARTEWKEST